MSFLLSCSLLYWTNCDLKHFFSSPINNVCPGLWYQRWLTVSVGSKLHSSSPVCLCETMNCWILRGPGATQGILGLLTRKEMKLCDLAVLNLSPYNPTSVKGPPPSLWATLLSSLNASVNLHRGRDVQSVPSQTKLNRVTLLWFFIILNVIAGFFK